MNGDLEKCIPQVLNSDVAGPGVRFALYLQALSSSMRGDSAK